MYTIDNIDNMRIKLRNKYIFFIILAIFLAVLYFIYYGANLEGIFLFSIIYCWLVKLFTYNSLKKYKIAFKEYFVRNSLAKVFDNLSYHPESGIDRDVIADTNMMYMGNRYKSNDLVVGSYKNIGFTQADVHIEERKSNGSNGSKYVTIFKGRWMIFDFNKKFKSNVQVCQKGFGNNKVKSLFDEEKLKYVEMESQRFNEEFSVYAEQPVDAFYILTPKMMENIHILDFMNGGKLLLCFVDSKLHVGIYDNNDSFEPGSVFSKINVVDIAKEVSLDINKIIMFIDKLDLDNDLFKI